LAARLSACCCEESRAGESTVVVVASAVPCWQNEANSLDNLAAVERALMEQVGTFDACTDVAAV